MPESLEGRWHGKELEIAVIFAADQDGAHTGTFKIIGHGDLPIGDILLDDTLITLKIKSAGFDVVGTIHMGKCAITAEFRQGDTVIPLVLKRGEG